MADATTDAGRALLLRRFRREVDENIAEGERRFPGMETVPPEVWVAVLVEEVGKLARTMNKLRLAEDADVLRHWNEEAMHRMVTCSAVLSRFAVKLDRGDFKGGRQ